MMDFSISDCKLKRAKVLENLPTHSTEAKGLFFFLLPITFFLDMKTPSPASPGPSQLASFVSIEFLLPGPKYLPHYFPFIPFI
jgi:hypothetical protein